MKLLFQWFASSSLVYGKLIKQTIQDVNFIVCSEKMGCINKFGVHSNYKDIK